jgi:hypothetical protein
MRYARLGVLLAGLTLLACLAFVPAGRCESETPTAVYMKYHDVLMKAKSVDEIKLFMSKKVQGMMNSTPADQAKVMFGLMKITSPVVVHLESETIDGDKASLKLTGSSAPQPPADKDAPKWSEKLTGVISMVQEDGTWKIEHESWKDDTTVSGGDPTKP